tara:strand:+ start:389407 stop:389667 length:261 start_codon:yes stop_codon:yes gene_type:complete
MFRTKPCEIEARQFDGTNHREILSFVYPGMSEDGLAGAEAMNLPIVIKTLEGDMTASEGDWVVKGLKGEFYPVKPDIFALKYEQIA